MDNDFFLNSGLPPPPLHFESTSSSAWNSLSLSSAMDPFLNPDHSHFDFDSTLSSMVSSPAASNSNDSFAVRELIGKLGNIGEISAAHTAYSYNTPINSPPKLTLPNLGKSGPLNSTVAEFSADPGFAERAARFSCFGSRSFNGRSNTTQLSLGQFRSNPSPGNGKLSRVSSSPSLKAQHNQSSPSMAPQLVNSQEESTVSEQNPVGENELNSRKRKAVSKLKGKESPPTQPAKGCEADGDSNGKRCKEAETEEDEKKQSNQKPPEAPKDYIHVRARRGQATDSHSLAERVRREKIGERMKLLQDLVPGCNKVTGKALMLDEIINYVQSLQRQAEFLSMKLASVNTSTGFDMDSLASKNMFQSNATSTFPLDSSAFFGQQNQALHGHISNGTPNESSVDPLDSPLCTNLDGYCQGPPHPQYRTFCGDDLQSIVQMGFAQNPALLSQNVQGSTQEPSPMKIEL